MEAEGEGLHPILDGGGSEKWKSLAWKKNPLSFLLRTFGAPPNRQIAEKRFFRGVFRTAGPLKYEKDPSGTKKPTDRPISSGAHVEGG